jgi:hypothetical protein
MVYVDTLLETTEEEFKRFPFKYHCHMIADSLNELMRMADKIRLSRRFSQGEPPYLHFDLNESKRKKAVDFGAKEVSCNELGRISLNNKREFSKEEIN